ncbi:hypothetical protein EOPP23_04845 [Endozoicomonas sp. OPT23]|uniref:hypothetical protein n=1 Tax=Endozoicomonas sp. OPT23 TaxID=2072845 RepID=UPI00129B876D|nr:hypothetical protein [Endozoicomonas sp. OPT23]MRI32322.1 hypothetical protein [Endozoicomonas sp. OPT23]
MIVTIPREAVFSRAIIQIILIVASVGILSACTNNQHNSPNKALEKLDISELKMAMLADISSTVVSDGELSGEVKTDIARLAITPLRRSPEIQIAGNDAITRPVAVTFQKAFEQSLLNMIAESQVSDAAAIIHTRKPTTPLCNPAKQALKASMAKAMQSDPKRIKTIEDRTVTLRDMASTGAPLNLHVAYIKGGLDQRSTTEQAVYRQEIENAANTSLHDDEMNCTEMPDDIVGASYILKTKMGHTLYFANNGTQAKDAGKQTLWRYWFGGLNDASVDKRYNEVMDYLKECGLDLTR